MSVNLVDDDDDSVLARYKEEIKYYEKESGSWDERARKILRRYKDERSPREARVPRYNILYSNTQTLLPAIYGKNPKADIERRFRDKDPLGRVTSDVLERCTDYFVNTEAFQSALSSALLDRLLPGRGTVWARYVPHFRDVEIQGTEEERQEGYQATDEEEPLEEVYNEEAITEYVSWSDIGHNWARTYDEIYLQWKKVYQTKKELKKRFGDEIAALIPLDYMPKGLNDEKKETTLKKAVIYECWDKQDKKVRWLHKDVVQFLDEKDDPLRLPDFFPCPKHLYAVLANDSMIPVPDYVEYQDQALELDELTSRIGSITKSLKVAGVYDASAPGVERLLAEGVENKLIPVEQWAVHSEKGGLKGVMDFLPLESIMKALLGLYEARDKVKNDLYEITGMSDILRGANNPNESATATNTKNKFITMRLSSSQDQMARFARDAVKNVACIIAEHFSIDTIKKISGIKLMTDMEKQQFQMQQQQHQQMYQYAQQQHQMIAQQSQSSGQQPPPAPPPPPPIDDDIQELLDNPSWEQVEQLLRDEPSLSFKIDIEIDSTIKMDEEADKASTVEFLESVGKFMAQMKDAPPMAQPLLAHLLMFGVRKFNSGKGVEAQIQMFANKVEKMAAQAGNTPPPDPAMEKAKADIQIAQATQEAQAKQDQEEHQMEMLENERQHQQRMDEISREAALKEKQMQMDFAFKMREAQMHADNDMKKHALSTDAASKPAVQFDTGALSETAKNLGGLAEGIVKSHTDNNAAMTNAITLLGKHIESLHQYNSKPKTVSMLSHDGRTITAQVQ